MSGPAGTSGRTERWAGPLALAGAAVACAMVAIAAAGEPFRGAATGSSHLRSAPWVLAVPVAAVVLLGFVALASVRRTDGLKLRARRPRWLVSLGFLALILFLVLLKPGHAKQVDRRQGAQVGSPAATSGHRSTPWPVWLIIGTGGALAMVGLAHRRRPASDAVDDGPADTARRALADSAADLTATEDPRQAVIAAYARLLDGLRDVGAGRLPSEAPFEHLSRVLHSLGVRDAPLRSLTTLFAEARFSTHPITESHRQAALAALEEARADLNEMVVSCG